jgi:hypothetical protein
MLSNKCLHLLPCLYVTYVPPCNVPSIMCFRRQSVSKIWKIQLAFILFTACKVFLPSLPMCNISFFTRSVSLIFSFLLHHHTSKLFQVFLIWFLKCLIFSTLKCCAPNAAFYLFRPQIYVKFVGKILLPLFNAAFSMAILNLITRVRLVSLGVMLYM